MRALDATPIKAKYRQLSPWLDERRRRLWAAVEAEQLGFGGVSAVATAKVRSARALDPDGADG